MLDGKRVLITGGTGSLGKALVQRILTGRHGTPKSITIFSRDELKQHEMRLAYQGKKVATDEVIYRNFMNLLRFQIGDIRSYSSVLNVLRDADIVVNACAMKQVPACQYFPSEAVLTNITGAENIVNAIRDNELPVQKVIGISSDKATKPINAYGKSKALQEDIFIAANIGCRSTSFICVRYGNVLSSRGSVIPLFLEQIENGGPVTITLPEMTRFLLSLDHAVDTIFKALSEARAGEIYVPRLKSARVMDLAEILIDGRDIPIQEVGIRPGEKVHEVLVSAEETFHTVVRGQYYAIYPMLPELQFSDNNHATRELMEYSSKNHVMSKQELCNYLVKQGVIQEKAKQEVLA